MERYWLARLKPYNPDQGHLVRTYVYLKRGLLFKEQHGWYKITDEQVARELFELRQTDHPYAPKLFDIVKSTDEAVRAEAAKQLAESLSSSALQPSTPEALFGPSDAKEPNPFDDQPAETAEQDDDIPIDDPAPLDDVPVPTVPPSAARPAAQLRDSLDPTVTAPPVIRASKPRKR